MAPRTFAVGDIHGDFNHLELLWAQMPELLPEDTVVFLGDYIDRGPNSKEVIAWLRALPSRTKAKLVFLRGNHEDGWLRVIDRGWPEFLIPPGNGCWKCYSSYCNRPAEGESPSSDDFVSFMKGSFFPEEDVAWMRRLLWWYEDEHAIYVHAGLLKRGEHYLHPSETPKEQGLLWQRSPDFFRNYKGKRVICGHTATEDLPPELSAYTPADTSDLWFRGDVVAIDTKCGKKDGFLTAIELPDLLVYESRKK